MQILLRMSFVVFMATACFAQKINISTPSSDKGGIVTVTLSYGQSDPDFVPRACNWYSNRNGNMSLIHSGVDSFQREFAEGFFYISLICDGSTKTVDRRQYTEVVKFIVHPRTEVQRQPFPSQ